MAFVKGKDLGFDRKNLVVFRMGPVLSREYEGFRAELLRNPAILGVTAGLQNPVNISSTVMGTAVDWTGKDPATRVTLNWDYVGYEYFETPRYQPLYAHVGETIDLGDTLVIDPGYVAGGILLAGTVAVPGGRLLPRPRLSPRLRL